MCALKTGKPKSISREDAETMALQALGFLAEDPRRLTRFLALTGMEPDGLMAAAETTPVQSATLDHLLSDESLLLVFAANTGVAPETVAVARALLDRGPDTGGWA
jgi:hypothetical protein